MLTHSLQSCLTLCNPMNCSPPGSSVHGILQARIQEWVALPSSRGSISCLPAYPALHTVGFFTHRSHLRSQEKLYKVRKIKTRIWLWLLIAKFRLKLKKVGKTTRPLRYDLNQIPYNYTVEVNSLLLSFIEGKFQPPLLSASGPLHLLYPLFLQTVSGHTHTLSTAAPTSSPFNLHVITFTVFIRFTAPCLLLVF